MKRFICCISRVGELVRANHCTECDSGSIDFPNPPGPAKGRDPDDT